MKYEETERESERQTVLLFEGLTPIKLAIAWKLVERKGNGAGWGSCEFSFNSWCALAGLPPSQYNMRLCERMINLDIVFPDGQVHYWMQKNIQAYMQGGF